MRRSTALVVQHCPTEGPGWLGEWLPDAGVDLRVCRPDRAEPVPDRVPADALVVLGGPMSAYGDTAPWIPATLDLLQAALADGVPTLGVCLGAQLLAVAGGGEVRRGSVGPELGAGEVTRTGAADPLLGALPDRFAVVQWHWDAVTRLPAGAVLLARSDRYDTQAFRVGTDAWALQFHLEAPVALVAGWARADAAGVRASGLDPVDLVAGAAAVETDVERVGRALAVAFAGQVRGR